MESKCWPGIAALGVVVGLGGPTMAEDQVATGAAFMKGGQFCLDMSAADRPGTFQHLMLFVEPAGDAIAEVHAIQHELGIPTRFIGTGEKPGDFAPFDRDAFVNRIL
jgi:hypothetical protein